MDTAVLKQDLDGTKKRVDKLEHNVEIIGKTLNEISVTNAQRDSTLETIKNNTQQTNDRLLHLLERSMDTGNKNSLNGKKFYQRLILTLISTLTTLLLAAYGASKLIS